MTSLTYRQYHRGVPVFAGELKTHFNARRQLSAVNGMFVPAVSLNTSPSRTWQDASKVAVSKVENDMAVSALSARGTALLVYPDGLARGVPGPNHLAWQVEVGNGTDVREFVYVDAHTGKVVDQITGITTRCTAAPTTGRTCRTVPPVLPGQPVLGGRRALPDRDTEADNMIAASKETYDFFSTPSAAIPSTAPARSWTRSSTAATSCPNASWNGAFISFCPGYHRRRDGARVGPRLHASTRTASSTPGSPARSTSPTRTSGVRRSTASTAAASTRPIGPRTAGTCSAFSTPRRRRS